MSPDCCHESQHQYDIDRELVILCRWIALGNFTLQEVRCKNSSSSPRFPISHRPHSSFSGYSYMSSQRRREAEHTFTDRIIAERADVLEKSPRCCHSVPL